MPLATRALHQSSQEERLFMHLEAGWLLVAVQSIRAHADLFAVIDRFSAKNLGSVLCVAPVQKRRPPSHCPHDLKLPSLSGGLVFCLVVGGLFGVVSSR
jgi:hypothetical protein